MGMGVQAERRDQPRRTFRGAVELAVPEDNDGYEADGVDLSVSGMSVRTSFLPDVGAEMDCRFALESGQKVSARGEVVWASEKGRSGGAFGLRFTDLSVDAEKAIRESLTRATDSPAPGSADAKSLAVAESPKARLFIPGMEAPLRARVHTSMDDVIVLGSELSFLKLGDAVHVEHDGTRIAGGIEDVGVEIDATSQVVRLVLTITKHDRARAQAHPVLPARPTRDVPAPIVIESPRAAKVASEPVDRPTLAPRRRGAQATEQVPEGEVDDEPMNAIESDDGETASAPTSKHRAQSATQSVPNAHEIDDDPEAHTADAEAHGEGTPATRTPPAWLVRIVGFVRMAALAIVRGAGPFAKKIVSLIARGASWTTAQVRARMGQKNVESAQEHTGGRRPQQSPRVALAAAVAAPQPRRKVGLYVLASVGLAAIAFALFTGRRAPRMRRPQPQVAMNAAPATEPTTPATDESTTGAGHAATAPGATDPSADPTGAGTASAAGADMQGEPSSEPTRAATGAANAPMRRGASTVAAGAAGRTMPSDLVAAARSRSANLDETPSIRMANGAVRPSTAQGQLSMVRNHAAVAASTPRSPGAVTVTPRGAATLGNPAIRAGTVLRLRMDGAIAGLAGGATGNTITIRMAGRRPAEGAAGLARLDPRLAGSGVYVRNNGSELVLRFRQNAPVFAARAQGTSVIVTLAAPPAPARGRPGTSVASAAHGAPRTAQQSARALPPRR